MSGTRVVICGAGIAGVTAAYHLAVRHGIQDVVLVDSRNPMSLTSDKGTQGYRNWWPGPDDTMLRFVSRSIDLLEEIADQTGNIFRLNRRGYLFVTADESGVEHLRSTARDVSAFGMGALREHANLSAYAPAPAEGYRDQPTGADLLLGEAARTAFPFLAHGTQAALHVRRAGWMNAVALGAWMFERAVAAGVTFRRGRVTAMESTGGRVARVRLDSHEAIETDCVVIAAGPELPASLQMLGVELPLFHELHAKLTFPDAQTVIPRSAPFTIWIDPASLVLNPGERDDASKRHLLAPFPGGVHVRPVDGPGGNELFLIWTYHTMAATFQWPPEVDPHYGDICLRGLAAMVPGMATYVRTPERGFVDGGYYCKTIDNRPLVGALPVEGAYVIGALSGTGIMSSQACAELLSMHVTGGALPDYANAFAPERFSDAAYLQQIEEWGALTGQL